LNYPKGNENVYTSYQGKGGIPLDSVWKRLLFSWTQADINILLTAYRGRKAKSRFEKRAGAYFASGALLASGQDPYAVVSEG